MRKRGETAIPGLVWAHHAGMTSLLRRLAPRNDGGARYAFAPPPIISGCCTSETAGDIRITSAWAAKIAAAR